MKILIVSVNYWPEVTGIGAFTTYRAEHLASVGHEVTVCTTYPYYPEWKVRDEYKGKIWYKEIRNRVEVIRTWAYIPSAVKSISRIFHEVSFSLSVLFRLLFRCKPDVMLVVSPPLGLAIVAIILSKIWNTPFIFDVEDLQPDSASDLSMLPKWLVRILYRIENAAYANAELISTITRGMREKIQKKGDWKEKVVLFEPRLDPSLLGVSEFDAWLFREKYSMLGKFIVTHSGNMGVKQALTTIIEAAGLMEEYKDILFLIVGDGAMKEKVQKQAASLSNILFLPLLDSTDYKGLLAASGVCLVTQQKAVSEIAFPSKVVSYLSAGCPVISSANELSEVALTVSESGAGYVVPAEDAPLLAKAILEIKKADRKELADNARLYACQRWNEDRVLSYIEKCLVWASEKSTLCNLQEDDTR